jgi:hypothetical protein
LLQESDELSVEEFLIKSSTWLQLAILEKTSTKHNMV